MPLSDLAYLYIGTADFDRDCLYYEKVLGAERVWAFHAYGAKVAAFRVCDHLEAGGAGVGAHLLEGADTVAPQGFEERRLRLHADHVRSDSIDEAAA